MVFSLEHDIKVTKSHQNFLPTQTVIVAHAVQKTNSFRKKIPKNDKTSCCRQECTFKKEKKMTEKIITPRLSKQSLQFHGYVKKWSKKLSVIKKKL
jgi:hypothetical protein